VQNKRKKERRGEEIREAVEHYHDSEKHPQAETM
jgi:hypothetical protein